MQLQVVPVTPFQQNCSVIWCDRTLAAAIVDPGGELERVLEVVAANKLELQGHGPMSSFGAERRTNPFVADRLLAPQRSAAAERGA